MTPNNFSRRDVLCGLGGLALTHTIPASLGPLVIQGGCSSFPIAAQRNRSWPVSGVEAYAEKSVAAGGTVHFHVSSPYDYTLSVVRLGWEIDELQHERDWFVTPTPFPRTAAARTYTKGSYVHVESALDPSLSFAELTLETWVRPFRVSGELQGVITQYTESSAFGCGLFINGSGSPYLRFGSGSVITTLVGPPLQARQWYHVVAVFQAGTATLYLNGVAIVLSSAPSTVNLGQAPLRLGASGFDNAGTLQTRHFLDGDLAMPVIYNRALASNEILARYREVFPLPGFNPMPPSIPTGSSVIGCWPLTEETGTSVADASSCGRTGTIVNKGTWMIGGPSFNAAAHGPIATYDPVTDPLRGHGLRLSSDDVYGLRWPETASFAIPSECPPGVYVGRILYHTTMGGPELRYDVTFVVRRNPLRPAAPIVVLCATNTWHAYNQSLGLFSFYVPHSADQPTYYQGINMPWSNPAPAGGLGNADPYRRYANSLYNYSHLVRAERFLHVWLEQNGYDYDVISDQDLHTTPGVLSSYPVMFIAGHSEYWTVEARDEVLSYLNTGGNLIMASGNTMFWRVRIDGSVIECRKWNPGNALIGGFGNALSGELYHEHDSLRGGLMREAGYPAQAGYPAWQVTGLECRGFDGDHVPFVVTDGSHPLFQAPESVNVPNGTAIGGPYGAGHEWDVRLQSIPGSPAQPVVPSVLAQATSNGTQPVLIDYQGNLDSSMAVISEIVEWQNGNGHVFSVGSIAAGKSLHDDPKLAALFRNVLHQYGVGVRMQALGLGIHGRINEASFDGTSWSTLVPDTTLGFGANPPTGVQWGTNSLASMAVNAVGAFYYRFWTGAAWSGWSDISFGNSFQGRAAAVGWGRNRLDLFALSSVGHLLHRAWDGSSWGLWGDLDPSNSFASDPAAVAWEGNHLSVALLGTAFNVRYREFNFGAWGAWQDLGGSMAFAPTLLAWGGKRLSIFAVDSATRELLWRLRWNGTWIQSTFQWGSLGLPPNASGTGTVALASRVHAGVAGPNQVKVLGVGADGRLKVNSFNGTTGIWADLGGGPFVGEPAVASYRGGYLSVVVVGADRKLWRIDWNGGAWSTWVDMAGTLLASPAVFSWIQSA